MIRLLTYQTTSNELRRFAGIMATVFAFIGAWVYWREGRMAVWTIVASLVILVPGIFIPRLLAPFYRLWMNVGHGLGWINTRIILGVMFFGIITPLGLFRRVIGKSGLQLRITPEYETYAIPCKGRTPEHFNWQF